jgi:uncharacterized Fe-S cluster-containing radical SAM superfamily protein
MIIIIICYLNTFSLVQLGILNQNQHLHRTLSNSSQPSRPSAGFNIHLQRKGKLRTTALHKMAELYKYYRFKYYYFYNGSVGSTAHEKSLITTLSMILKEHSTEATDRKFSITWQLKRERKRKKKRSQSWRTCPHSTAACHKTAAFRHE